MVYLYGRRSDGTLVRNLYNSMMSCCEAPQEPTTVRQKDKFYMETGEPDAFSPQEPSSRVVFFSPPPSKKSPRA